MINLYDMYTGSGLIPRIDTLLDMASLRDTPELRARAAKNAHFAVEYATKVSHKPFPEAEDVIATDPEASLEYAKEVLKGRFRAGETAISTDPTMSYKYAVACLKYNRFYAAEHHMLKDYIVAYRYILDVMKQPWPEFEHLLIKSGNERYMYIYAKNILKRRWPEAEPDMKRNPLIWGNYITAFPDA